MKTQSRREFLKESAGATIGASVLTAMNKAAYAAGSDRIRVGLVGCGGRGSGAAVNAIEADQAVDIAALGDLFESRMSGAGGKMIQQLIKLRQPRERFKVTKDTTFVGLDAYKKVIDSDIDYVMLATPPHWRPAHLKYAVEAGKHVFMEKPVAVDPVGIRSVLKSVELAKQKGLTVVAGTQRHHQKHYIEIMRRIHNGDIGEIVAAQCYWMQQGIEFFDRKPEWSDMEWQLRTWYYFTWLSGDHIVEQHVHNIDVVNWAMQAHPVKALGLGGRQVRTAPKYGNIYDHFGVEYEYPNGARVLSMCRQQDGCSDRISEHIVGTNGMAYTDSTMGRIDGPNAYTYNGPNPDPYVVEHMDLIASIRSGAALNEGVQVAESTLTGILGRMSAYTGREIKWDWVMNSSKLDLTPPSYEYGDFPVRPVAMPGQTPLI